MEELYLMMEQNELMEEQRAQMEYQLTMMEEMSTLLSKIKRMYRRAKKARKQFRHHIHRDMDMLLDRTDILANQLDALNLNVALLADSVKEKSRK